MFYLSILSFSLSSASTILFSIICSFVSVDHHFHFIFTLALWFFFHCSLSNLVPIIIIIACLLLQIGFILLTNENCYFSFSILYHQKNWRTHRSILILCTYDLPNVCFSCPGFYCSWLYGFCVRLFFLPKPPPIPMPKPHHHCATLIPFWIQQQHF